MREVRPTDDPALEWHDGSGDLTLLLGHATGFCKEVWRPVVASLREQDIGAPALAWDARGHGRASALEPPVSWWTFAHDLVVMLDDLSGSSRLDGALVGVGHSMGGATMVMAEVLRPGTFAGLVLIEPVLIPPPFVRTPDLSLALRASKRRPTFESRRALIDNYLEKPLFRRWYPEAFDAYVEYGFREVAEGVTLRCPREIEAEVFATGAECGVFARLHEVRTPVRVLITDYPGDLERVMAHLPGAFPDMSVTYLAGQNHLVPMERPDLVAAEIGDFIASSQ